MTSITHCLSSQKGMERLRHLRRPCDSKWDRQFAKFCRLVEVFTAAIHSGNQVDPRKLDQIRSRIWKVHTNAATSEGSQNELVRLEQELDRPFYTSRRKNPLANRVSFPPLLDGRKAPFLALCVFAACLPMLTAVRAAETGKCVYAEVRPNLYVEPLGSSEFLDATEEAVTEIEANPVGRRLLKDLHTTPVLIRRGTVSSYSGQMSRTYNGAPFPELKVTFSPTTDVLFSTTLAPIASPPAVKLFHELDHVRAYRDDTSASTHETDPLIWGIDEEYRAIASENEFRKAAGLPERLGHAAPPDDGASVDPLIQVRLRLFRDMIQKSRAISPSAPLPKRCMRGDLEPVGGVIMYIQMHIDNIPKDFYMQYNQGFELFQEDETHIIVDSKTPEFETMVRNFFPQLSGQKFKVVECTLLLVSRAEMEEIIASPKR